MVARSRAIATGNRADRQWLANRGYAVLSIDYRGSNGLGKARVNAGNKAGNKE
jgi:dipeptidyl aminopeptidase/acylaminoacyl peptidase